MKFFEEPLLRKFTHRARQTSLRDGKAATKWQIFFLSNEHEPKWPLSQKKKKRWDEK